MNAPHVWECCRPPFIPEHLGGGERHPEGEVGGGGERHTQARSGISSTSLFVIIDYVFIWHFQGQRVSKGIFRRPALKTQMTASTKEVKAIHARHQPLHARTHTAATSMNTN